MSKFPVGPVPTQLASFFQAGGLNRLLTLFNRTGGGLGYYNALRKMFPRPSDLPNWFYQQLLGYLTGFVGAFKQTPGLLTGLQGTDLIPFDDTPRNIFVRSPDAIRDRYMVRFEYDVCSDDGKKRFHVTDDTWFTDLMSLDDLYEDIKQRIRVKVMLVNAANKTGDRYELCDDTLTIAGMLRRY